MLRLMVLMSLFTIANVFTQEIMSPMEIFKVIADSEKMYKFEILEDEIEAPNREDLVNLLGIQRELIDGQFEVNVFEIDEKNQKLLKKAEEYFFKKQFDRARDLYKEILIDYPNYSRMMTFIGQTYEKEKNYMDAIVWFQKAINANYVDYMAHWFLADCHYLNGEYEKALDGITIAKILNRNNPRLMERLQVIYAENGIKYDNWVFNPQIIVEENEEGGIEVAATEEWASYAFCKAAWKHEESISKNREIDPGQLAFFHEKECLLGIVINLNEKNETSEYPELNSLVKAVENKLINEYVVYEIFLLDEPDVVYQLPIEFIENIKDYILNVRCKKMD